MARLKPSPTGDAGLKSCAAIGGKAARLRCGFSPDFGGASPQRGPAGDARRREALPYRDACPTGEQGPHWN